MVFFLLSLFNLFLGGLQYSPKDPLLASLQGKNVKYLIINYDKGDFIRTDSLIFNKRGNLIKKIQNNSFEEYSYNEQGKLEAKIIVSQTTLRLNFEYVKLSSSNEICNVFYLQKDRSGNTVKKLYSSVLNYYEAGYPKTELDLHDSSSVVYRWQDDKLVRKCSLDKQSQITDEFLYYYGEDSKLDSIVQEHYGMTVRKYFFDQDEYLYKTYSDVYLEGAVRYNFH